MPTFYDIIPQPANGIYSTNGIIIVLVAATCQMDSYILATVEIEWVDDCNLTIPRLPLRGFQAEYGKGATYGQSNNANTVQPLHPQVYTHTHTHTHTHTFYLSHTSLLCP